jgi:hypothetical protein
MFALTTTLDLVTTLHTDRQAAARRGRLTRIAECVAACCSPSSLTRLVRAFRGEPADC